MIDDIDESWKPFFFNGIEKQFFRDIIALNADTTLPDKENIFRVFEMPLNKIKVVILGQDPYPQPNIAVGLAFAVSNRTAKPPSLLNIEKEIGVEIDRTLIPWVNQGVFLLNTALTVKKYNAGSHLNFWKPFTVKVIQHISKNQPCIWLLWGKNAQSYIPYISNFVYQYRNEGEEDKNVILTAAHPASAAYREDAGFFDCNHFNQVNQILAKQGLTEINWY